MDRRGGLDQPGGQHRAGALAEPHAEVQQRLLVEPVEQSGMRLFRRAVADLAVVEAGRRHQMQRRRRGAGDKAVEQHRHALQPSGDDRAEDRRQLPPAEPTQHFQRVGQRRTVARDRGFDHVALPREAGRIDARAVPDPIGRGTTEQRQRDRRRGGRVGDAHLADAEQVDAVRQRRHAALDRREAVGFRHRRGLGEVGGRPVEVERDDGKLGADRSAELIDRGAARGEVGDHLRGHFGGIGGNAARGDAVIAGEDQRLDPRDPRPGRSLPGGKPERDLLQPTERAGRLGEPGIPGARRGGGRFVGTRKAVDQPAKVGEASEVR